MTWLEVKEEEMKQNAHFGNRELRLIKRRRTCLVIGIPNWTAICVIIHCRLNIVKNRYVLLSIESFVIA